MVECRDEHTFADTHTVDLQQAVGHFRWCLPWWLHLCRNVHCHALASSSCPVQTINLVSFDADNTVCMLWFEVSYNSDWHSVALEIAARCWTASGLDSAAAFKTYTGGVWNTGVCARWAASGVCMLTLMSVVPGRLGPRSAHRLPRCWSRKPDCQRLCTVGILPGCTDWLSSKYNSSHNSEKWLNSTIL